MKKLLLAALMLPMMATAQSPEDLQPEHRDWVELMKDNDLTFDEIVQLHDEYWEGREITPGCGYKPFKRWQWQRQDRLRPDGRSLTGRQIADMYADVRDFQSMRSPAGNWLPVGPILDEITTRDDINGVGRVNCIAFHPTDPNTMLLGTPSGGIWRSYDGGENWESSSDNLPTLGVSAIAYHPNDPQIVYMGTGDRDHNDAPGMGMMKSTDGGVNWEFINNGIENLTIGDVLIHPNDPTIIIIATNDGIFRSADSGDSWSFESLNAADYRDLKFHPTNPDIVYATGSGKFYRSEDAGETWDWVNQGLQSGYRMVIGVTPSNPDLVYVCSSTFDEFHKFFKSSDAGVSFQTQADSPNILGWAADGSGDGGQAWYDFCMAADPIDSNVVYVGGVRMKKSVDGGVTWSDINPGYLHVDQHELEFSPYNNDLYLCNDGGMYQYVDNTDWLDISQKIVCAQVYKIGQSPHNSEKVLAGFQDNGTSEYIGSKWVRRGGGDGFDAWYDQTDEAYRYGSIQYGRVYRTGPNYTNQQIVGEDVLGIDETGSWSVPYFLSYWDENTMYVALKNVWRCTNVKEPILDSVKWERISWNLGGNNATNMNQLTACKSDTNKVYASEGNRKLFRTDNALDSAVVWVDMSNNLPVVSQPVRAIETHPTDTNIVYIAFDQKIWKSVDQGGSWEDISGSLPEINYNTIAYDVNTDEGLYIGGDMGIYYKDASMEDWVDFSQGFPLAAWVTEIEIFYGETPEENRLRAGTFGRGVWESDLFSTETYNFPASALLENATGEPEVFGEFDAHVRFYKNLSVVGVTDFEVADVYVENATLNSIDEDGDLYTLNLTPETFGLVKIYVPDGAALDDLGLMTDDSDTLQLVYNPIPAEFGIYGPGGVGDDETLAYWYRADAGVLNDGDAVTSTGDMVDQWEDQGGSGPDALQTDNGSRPSYVAAEDGINNKPALHFNGEGQYILASDVEPGENLSFMSMVEADSTAFTTHGWIASSRGPNGFVMHPWKNESRVSAVVIDNEDNYASGPVQYIGDAAAPHIYGFVYERSDYYSIHHTLFDANRWVWNGADIGPRDANAMVDVQIGWDYDDRFGKGKVAEQYLLNRRIFESHRTIMANYMAAKYGIDLGALKRYGHINEHHEVAGIGMMTEYDYHFDAQGTSNVRMSDPSAPDAEEFVMWGHDNDAFSWVPEEYPILSQRIDRTWGIEETGDMGDVLVRIYDADGVLDIGEDIGLIVGEGDAFEPGSFPEFYPLTEDGDVYSALVDWPENGVFTIGVEPAVGVEDLSKAELNIFPNPSAGIFNVSLGNTSLDQFVLQLFDQSGRLVHETNFSGRSYTFDASALASGVYVCKISSNGQQVIKELVKY
jgi:photosystem II stability/assembly factor-like uncharacterized protein